MLRTTHKLTAIKSPIPLLLKDKDSSKMIPMYPIPNKSAIATSCVSWHYPTIKILILHLECETRSYRRILGKKPD